MKNQQEENYPLSRKIQDISNVFLLLDKTLHSVGEFYLQKSDIDEVVEGVASLSRILHTFTETIAVECLEREEEHL